MLFLIMIRTQVQIPDGLYGAAKQLADRMEISLTELVRRGLEYMISVAPPTACDRAEWKLPAAHNLGGTDPFAAPDWRERIHTERLKVAETAVPYGKKESPA
jgi:hypothetical protein